MDFRVLGPVEVGDGSEAPAPTRAKERRVLALLLAHANQVVSADRVAEALWPGPGAPEHAARSVQTHVSRLRSALGPAGERLLTRPPGYLLRVEPDELDARRFETLIDQARDRADEDPDKALALLDQALGLWRGPPYGEFRDEEFAVGGAVRLEELRLVAVEERIDARLALGHHAEEVGELEALCAAHPLRERLRSQLMVALYRSGRQPDALRAFEDYRRVLAEDLGLDPSPELRALERRILGHDPVLAPGRPQTGPPVPVVAPVTSFVGREADEGDLIRLLDGARLVTLTGPGGWARPGSPCRWRRRWRRDSPTARWCASSPPWPIPTPSPRRSPPPSGSSPAPTAASPPALPTCCAPGRCCWWSTTASTSSMPPPRCSPPWSGPARTSPCWPPAGSAWPSRVNRCGPSHPCRSRRPSSSSATGRAPCAPPSTAAARHEPTSSTPAAGSTVCRLPSSWRRPGPRP